MRIGELARQTNLSASRIRFYEANNLIPKADRQVNGYRNYPESMVVALQFIDRAQRLGFTLSEIQSGFGDAGRALPSRSAIVDGLQKKLDEIDRHIEESKRRRKEIETLVEELKACS